MKIWELRIGNKTIEGDNPDKYKKLLDRLKKASKKAHNRRKTRIKG
jgi:hypothetical protein